MLRAAAVGRCCCSEGENAGFVRLVPISPEDELVVGVGGDGGESKDKSGGGLLLLGPSLLAMIKTFMSK